MSLVSALDHLTHDFRAVVQYLRNDLGLLKGLGHDKIPLDITSRLSRTIGHADLLTDDLTSSVLSQLGENRSNVRIELFVPFVCRRVADDQTSRHKAEGAKISVYCIGDGDFCFVKAHLAQLNRVLRNLVDNALEACETDDKDVVIQVSKVDTAIQIRVTDRGAGMDPSNVGIFSIPPIAPKGAVTAVGLQVVIR